MKKILEDNLFRSITLGLIALAIILVIFFLNARSNKLPSDETGKLSAVATTFPIYDILRTVGGDQVDSSLLLAPGASPHSFELSPQKAKSLSDANLFIYNGLGLDSWASSMSLANTSKGAEVRRELDLSSHVNLLRFSDKEAVEVSEDDSQSHQEAHGREGDIDPHYWLDPINASLMAEAIAQELGELDPVNKDYYLNNASLFGRDLATKLTTWQSQINQLPSNKIIVFHDAWFYFANRFGIEIVGALEPFPGKSPSPKYLDQVSNLIKDNNISVLFIEPQLAPDLARALAQNLVSDIAILDPLGGVEGRESYIELIDYNINTLVSSLK